MELTPPAADPPPPLRRHPDIFTADEAAHYLSLPTVATLDTLKERGHLVGHQIGKAFMYHRTDLDRCALSMFGKLAEASLAGRPAAGGPTVGRSEKRAAMRLAGGTA